MVLSFNLHKHTGVPALFITYSSSSTWKTEEHTKQSFGLFSIQSKQAEPQYLVPKSNWIFWLRSKAAPHQLSYVEVACTNGHLLETCLMPCVSFLCRHNSYWVRCFKRRSMKLSRETGQLFSTYQTRSQRFLFAVLIKAGDKLYYLLAFLRASELRGQGETQSVPPQLILKDDDYDKILK